MAHFIILRGLRNKERYPLTDFPLLLGRDPQATICLPDTSLAPFHIRVKQRGRLFIIEDLTEKGIYLNGERVQNSILENLDRLLVGEVEILFSQPWDQLHINSTAVSSIITSEISPISLAQTPSSNLSRLHHTKI